MQLITNIQSVNDGEDLEYKHYGEKKIHTLTNATSHISDIYKFIAPSKGAENDRFIIKYSGNKKGEEQDVAHYILLKGKEASTYLIKVDTFNIMFVLA